MTEDQIKHMVNRFLAWKLPMPFNPDCGVSFKTHYNNGTETPAKYDPSGTNLFDATQATEMVRYMLDGLPIDPAEGANPIPIPQKPGMVTEAMVEAALDAHINGPATLKEYLNNFNTSDARELGVLKEGENFHGLDYIRGDQLRDCCRAIIRPALEAALSAVTVGQKDEAVGCPTCKGEGGWIEFVPSGPEIEEIAVKCDDCDGTGLAPPSPHRVEAWELWWVVIWHDGDLAPEYLAGPWYDKEHATYQAQRAIGTTDDQKDTIGLVSSIITQELIDGSWTEEA